MNKSEVVDGAMVVGPQAVWCCQQWLSDQRRFTGEGTSECEMRGMSS